MHRIQVAEGKKYINATVSLFNWHAHDRDICEHFAKYKKSGRPKKCHKNHGCIACEKKHICADASVHILT